MALLSDYHRSSRASWDPPTSQGHRVYKTSVYKKSKPSSVYGGAGGSGIRISSTSNSFEGLGYGLKHDYFFNDLLLEGNEKKSMQNLNERLALYLEKVHSLESKNSHLEKEIRLWYEKSSPVARKDYSAYYKTITELQTQITAAHMTNSQIILQIDNSKLAADDFRMKYETELSLRQAVESDSFRLQKLIDDLTLIKADLELQVEGLKEELLYLKKNHENETEELRKKLSGTVNVEVDAAPSIDLAQIMENMRKQYEIIAEKYRQEAKERFDTLTEEFNKEVTIITIEKESSQTQVIDQRRTLRSLEIELQSQQNMKTNFASNLADVEARYRVELGQIQAHIASIEAQLWQLRQNMEQQSMSYSILLDIKVKLEAEIATYRRLLEGEESRVTISEVEVDKTEDPNRVLRIRTVVEEIEDGKVVSARVDEREEKVMGIME